MHKATYGDRMIKVAYICEPQVGGTFSFFPDLRCAILKHGIDLRCICPFDRHSYKKGRFADCEGVDYISLSGEIKEDVRELIKHIIGEQYSVVMILPGCYIASTVLPLYLPRSVGTVAKIPHNARGVYHPTRIISGYLDHIVAVNDRLRDDLIGYPYRISSEMISVIHYGIDYNNDVTCLEDGVKKSVRKIYFCGRLEDVQKNIFILPKIAKLLKKRSISCRFIIIGSGPDGDRLRKRIRRSGVEECFEFTGAISHAEVLSTYEFGQIFVMPSRFEGCPNALLEAMGAGCVPVVSNLRGIFDTLFNNGTEGFLCELNKPADFAQRIEWLINNPEQCYSMAIAGQQSALGKYGIDRMAHKYAEVFQHVSNGDTEKRASPLSLNDFNVPNSLTATWRRFIPTSIKKVLRTLFSKVGFSV